MQPMQKQPQKAAVQTERCVACGCCVSVCPRAALRIHKGIYAVVTLAGCVGCGKCARECPAGSIVMQGVPA